MDHAGGLGGNNFPLKGKIGITIEYTHNSTAIEGNTLSLDERKVKDIHALLMENIQVGGVYRDVQVYISGARVPSRRYPDKEY